jgi:transcriptional regulator with XRE-family HTH domain
LRVIYHDLLPARLRELRGRMGRTATWVAHEAGVSTSMMPRIEDGRRTITLPVAVRIAGVLGVTPASLVEPVGWPPTPIRNPLRLSAQAFALRLAALRRAAGLTREELANLARVSVTTLARAEVALGYPYFVVAVRLAEALGLTVDDLIVT